MREITLSSLDFFGGASRPGKMSVWVRGKSQGFQVVPQLFLPFSLKFNTRETFDDSGTVRPALRIQRKKCC